MKRSFLVILVLTVTVCGCHMFEDVDNINNCPLNSSFPCPCSSSCENGHVCQIIEGDNRSYGQCTLPCFGENNVCALASQGYGTGRCMSDGYCAIGCIFEEDCPAGMLCASGTCVPGAKLDPGVLTRDTSTMVSDTVFPKNDTSSTLPDTETALDTSLPLAQRQTDCSVLVRKTFECAPDVQIVDEPTMNKWCIDDYWHNDPCFLCLQQSSCIELDCVRPPNWGTCYESCCL